MSTPISFSPSPDVLLVFFTDQTQLEARGGGPIEGSHIEQPLGVQTGEVGGEQKQRGNRRCPARLCAVILLASLSLFFFFLKHYSF